MRRWLERQALVHTTAPVCRAGGFLLYTAALMCQAIARQPVCVCVNEDQCYKWRWHESINDIYYAYNQSCA